MNKQEWIEYYHEKNYNLIPLAENSKVPVAGLSLERYFNEQYPVETLLDLSLKREINIGLVTGKTSNLAVIDVDTPDKTKLAEYLTQYPTDLIDRTPNRGGSHLFYEWREGLPEILKIDSGDFYAGSHYVVVAPSIINGKSYEWIKQGSPGVLPQQLFHKTFEMQTGKYTRSQILDLMNVAAERGMVDGQWNDTVLYGSMILAGDGWSEEAIYKHMMNLNKGERPIPARQVRSMVKRAMEYGAKDTYQKELPKLKEKAVQLGFSTYADIATKYSDYEANWLIDGWMLESAILILAAPPERFKTWLAVDLALSVASGLPFLDTYEVKHTGNVLIIQQEDFGARFFSRFKAVERSKLARAKLPVEVETDENGVTIYKPSDYNVSNKIFFHESAEFSLDNEESIDRLEQRVIELNAVLVIIDPFYSLSKQDDFFASAAEKIRERIKAIRNKTGAAFLFVHHTNKTGTVDGTDILSRNKIFGSQFVSAAMEGTWIAGRSKGMGNKEINVARFFKDETAQPITHITFHINMKAEDDEKAYVVEVNDIIEGLDEQLKKNLQETGSKTFTELFDIFGHNFASKTAFSRWLQSQAEKGIQQTGKRGKYFVEPDAG